MKRLILIISLLMILTGCRGREEESSRSYYREKIVYIINEDKPFTGVLIHRYSNQQPASEMRYKNGILHGDYTFYHKNGETQEKGSYRDGSIDDTVVAYYENGQIKEETNYSKGQLDGRYTLYYENGNVKAKGRYKDGKLHGKISAYSEDNELIFQKKYKDGKQNVKYRSGRNDQHAFDDMLMGKRHRNVLWGNFDIRFFSHHFDITAERDR